jgi:macrolide-specific efflux system membrane fusion protein
MRIRTAFAAIGLTVLVLLAACERPADDLELPAELSELGARTSAPTYPVERRDLAVEIERVARVQSVRLLELYFQEGGRLAELNVGTGDRVTQGQILARIASGPIQHNLRLAEIDLEIDRLRATSQNPGSSNVDRQIRQLELSKREESVDFLRRRLAAHTIRAPYDGVITRVNPEVDEVVEGYRTIIEIADPSDLELQMEVSVDQFDRVEVGQSAQVQITSGTWAPGTVSRLTTRTSGRDAALRREEYVVHLRLDQADAVSFRMGARHAARVLVDFRRDTLLIPVAALRAFQGRTYVRVLEGVQRREVDVKVGVRTDTRVEILEGLESGQTVIGK